MRAGNALRADVISKSWSSVAEALFDDVPALRGADRPVAEEEAEDGHGLWSGHGRYLSESDDLSVGMKVANLPESVMTS